MTCDLGYVIQHHIPALMQLLTNELKEYNMQLITTKCLNTAVMMWYLFLGEQSSLPFPMTDSLPSDTKKKCDSPRVCDSRSVSNKGTSARNQSSNFAAWKTNELNPYCVAKRFKEDLLDEDGNSNSAEEQSGSTRTLFYVILTDCELPEIQHADVKTGGSTKRKVIVKKTKHHKVKQMQGGNGLRTIRDLFQNQQDASSSSSRSLSKNWIDTHANPQNVHLDFKKEQFFPGHVFVIERFVYPSEKASRFNIYQSYINNYDLQGHQNLNRSLSVSRNVARDIADNFVKMFEQDAAHAWDESTTAFWERFAHVKCPQYEGHQFSLQSFMCYTKCNTQNCTNNLKILIQKKLSELNNDLKNKRVDPEAVYGNPVNYANSKPNTKSGKGNPNITDEIPSHLTNLEMKNEFEAILQKL